MAGARSRDVSAAVSHRGVHVCNAVRHVPPTSSMAGEDSDLLRWSRSARSAQNDDNLVELLRPLGLVLNEDEREQWSSVYQAVMESTQLIRHRASSDALMIQKTYRIIKSASESGICPVSHVKIS